MKKLIILAILFLCIPCQAAVNDRVSTLSTMDSESLPTLNNILMQDNRRLQILEADAATYATTTALAAYFNTSTGHDHDGSDSKKVLATNLDGTGLDSGTGYYLYNNSGTLATAALSTGAFTLVSSSNISAGGSATFSGLTAGIYKMVIRGDSASGGWAPYVTINGTVSATGAGGFSNGTGKLKISSENSTTGKLTAGEVLFIANHSDTSVVTVTGGIFSWGGTSSAYIFSSGGGILDSNSAFTTITYWGDGGGNGLSGTIFLYKLSTS